MEEDDDDDDNDDFVNFNEQAFRWDTCPCI